MGRVMEPRDVLVSTTRTAAEALGIDDEVGTIAPGKCADVIALREDPLVNLETLQDVAFVMHEGKVVRRDAV